MTQDLTPRLGLSRMLPAQAQKHVTFNEALERLDALTQGGLEGVDATDPPADPAAGALYALGAEPTGDWAGRGGMLALFQAGGWVFLTPLPGWHLWDAAGGTLRVWDGSAWAALGGTGEQVASLGVGTPPDATNRFAVSSEAVLFTHAGDDMRVTLNRAGPGDTASFVFQSGWSGRAEFGLMESDAFAIKTSGDGATWEVAATFTAQGETGLGTYTPQGRLHVAGDAVFGPVSGGASNGNLRLIDSDRYPRLQLFAGVIGTSCQRMWDTDTGAIYEDVDAATGLVQWRARSGGVPTDLMRLTAAGDLGIGTGQPRRKLHVADAMRLQPLAGPPASADAGDLYFDAGTNRLRCHDGSTWHDLF